MAPCEESGSWRQAERARLLALRVGMVAALRTQHQAAITQALLARFSPEPGTVVALYWPFKGEYDPRHVARQWRTRGVRSALPVVTGKGQPLQFREWWPGVATRPGVFGLPVPQGTELLAPDVVLMPPVGFDMRCFRLGYGGGYYDRTLAALRQRPVMKIGVGFELSRMATIFPQPHDIAMDLVVTEAGIHLSRE